MYPKQPSGGRNEALPGDLRQSSSAPGEGSGCCGHPLVHPCSEPHRNPALAWLAVGAWHPSAGIHSE